MDFTHTEEQEQVRSTVRRFLDEYSPEQEVRRLMMTSEGYDPAVWTRMANELGLQGLVIPESYGGSGASWVELGIVLEEMGRSLLCAPFLSTVLAATTLLESGDAEAQKAFLPGIAEGATVATVALVDAFGDHAGSATAISATPATGGYALTGRTSFVLDGATADIVLVLARTPSGPTLFVVRRDDPGFAATPLPTLDLTRKLAQIDLVDATGQPVGAEGEGLAILARVLDLASIALAAEQVGCAQAALEMAVAYSKVRIQFGQLIGSFQAIKHKCADVFVEVESAKSAAYYAFRAASDRSEELAACASLAKAFCSDAAVLATHENVQIHGGIGFTWEVAPHLYLKRARSMELYLGDPRYHRERLVQLIGG